MDFTHSHPNDWLHGIPTEQQIEYRCKRYPNTKYLHAVDGIQLDDPFDPRTETHRLSMDNEDVVYTPGIGPSPYKYDEDFKIVFGYGAQTRISKNAGPLIDNMLVSAINLRTTTGANDDDKLIIDGYLETHIISMIVGIYNRQDQGNRRKISEFPQKPAEWVVEKIIAPLSHFDRSVAMENIIARAVYKWNKLYTYEQPGPFNASLELASKEYFKETFNHDGRSGPRGNFAFYKAIAMLCDSYLAHVYGLDMRYTLDHRSLAYMKWRPYNMARCGTTAFTYGTKLPFTNKGWNQYLGKLKALVPHVITLASALRNKRGTVLRDDKGHPNYFHPDFARAVSNRVLAYLGEPDAIEIVHEYDSYHTHQYPEHNPLKRKLD